MNYLLNIDRGVENINSSVSKVIIYTYKNAVVINKEKNKCNEAMAPIS